MLDFGSEAWKNILFALAAAFIVTFIATPVVKSFAVQVGAIDVPDKKRHIHSHPIPRMGGLAIFIGFLLSVLLFADISTQVRGILLGAILIAVVGAIDDIVNLNAWLKFGVQIIAAVIAVLSGVIINVVTNPMLLTDGQAITIGVLAVPVTILWIVGVTNSVNLIDGLDGLACGVSAIASMSMLVVSMLVSTSNSNVATILAALCGACLGFIPYNLNPAKIFMGDTGALLLGYIRFERGDLRRAVGLREIQRAAAVDAHRRAAEVGADRRRIDIGRPAEDLALGLAEGRADRIRIVGVIPLGIGELAALLGAVGKAIVFGTVVDGRPRDPVRTHLDRPGHEQGHEVPVVGEAVTGQIGRIGREPCGDNLPRRAVGADRLAVREKHACP